MSEQLGFFERQPAPETFRSWLAALLDGEGYIGMVRNGDNIRPHVCVKMTDKRLVAILHETYGGSLSLNAAPNLRSRPYWSWVATGARIIAVLEDARPYLILKSEQADIVLGAAKSVKRGSNQLGAPGRLLRERQYRKLQTLNRKGPRSDSAVPGVS